MAHQLIKNVVDKFRASERKRKPEINWGEPSCPYEWRCDRGKDGEEDMVRTQEKRGAIWKGRWVGPWRFTNRAAQEDAEQHFAWKTNQKKD